MDASTKPDVIWTDELIAKLTPTRGGLFVGQWQAEDPDALFARIKVLADRRRPRLQVPVKLPAIHAILVRYGLERPTHLVAENEYAACAAFGTPLAGESVSQVDLFVRYWIAAAGPELALRALLGATRYVCFIAGSWTAPEIGLRPHPPNTLHPFALSSTSWSALRQYFAVAPSEEFAAALSRAAELRERATLSERVLLSLIFPEPGWAEQDLDDCVAVGTGAVPWGLLASVRRADKVSEAFLKAVDQHPLQASSGFVDDLVARCGPDAARALIVMAEHAPGAEYGPLCGQETRKFATALGRIRTPEVARFFVGKLDHKHLRPVAAEYLRNEPDLAIPALAEHVAARGACADVARTVLGPLIRTNDIDRILPALSEAARSIIESTRDRLAPKAEASLDRLPPVLASPPWMKGKKRSALPVVADIAVLAVPEALAFEPDDTARWGSISAGQWTQADALRDIEGFQPSAGRWLFAFQLLQVAPADAIRLLETSDLERFSWYGNVFGPLLAVCGLPVVPGLLRAAPFDMPSAVDALARVNSTRVAPLMADVFARLKSCRADARKWLMSFPETAATGLIPAAVGPRGRTRMSAEIALRYLASRGETGTLTKVARRYGPEVEAAFRAMLEFDPLQDYPTKLPKMPAFWQPGAFTRPLLRDRSAALPTSAVETLGTMLAFSPTDPPYPGIAQVKETCDPISLAAFAWDLFQAWLIAGAPSKEQWAFMALGHLGSDDTARQLTPLIRVWPTEGVSARAATGLDVLALMGSDAALYHLHGIAQKVKSRPLQEKAKVKLREVAELRGLTPEELADRLVPDLGLDDDGSLTLDYGPRQFRVTFDESLRPVALDTDRKRLKDLPKPAKTDDADKASVALLRWKGIKKEVRAIASTQVKRFEKAMCCQRRWSLDIFRQVFIGHPLLIHLVRRLVWGAFDEGGRLLRTFRIAEDSSAADEHDDALELAPDWRFGVVHPLELVEGQAEAWGRVFTDYAIIQPFEQLGRPCFTATPDEIQTTVLERVKGLRVPSVKVLGLDSRGWRKGPVGDGGMVWWYDKPLPEDRVFRLSFEPGLLGGGPTGEPTQTLGNVVILREGEWGESGASFSTVSSILMSELLGDLERLRG